MSYIRIVNKAVNRAVKSVMGIAYWVVTWFRFKVNGVTFSLKYYPNGFPVVNVNLKGSFSIGHNFRFNSGRRHNIIGRQQLCYFVVGPQGKLTIGNHVGISSTAIVCYESIIIGDNVKIGGNTVIYDTDFHSLKVSERTKVPEDFSKVKTKPVKIEDNAFIGAHTTILKGVVIGRNSIVGSCSVVTKNIPPDEIWAGNPARFIKKIEPENI
ncbi:succinyltransferase-like protein [Mucilaginibacter gracilis]|uniref:Succinyltransferase-like protein n=1 Tax=Mucilaginibacter gracilis TaxID=423350 RepID=A0A495IYC9_9SPHI|nr:acyltransferase [Mucilaginibacter gracilis]RKR81078.1 succinyltransferase-like protein [Mucilaginibacter gracilis]